MAISTEYVEKMRVFGVGRPDICIVQINIAEIGLNGSRPRQAVFIPAGYNTCFFVHLKASNG
ncbi:TPA: hypothetical protein R3V32_000463 [Enterobacter cloacae]|jgi:hypothetical protein|uniref:hypothetical protein n=1 Tax=Enterobacter cloacae TaxID=550 RepID=UPI002183B191|nr:hypothetical protein [Enterobacter cloacae]MCT2765945.1 hypothetical protein [Enterobacter cloacae]MCU6281330.1 hypothetical protein [Enterobacter cloacae]HEC5279019.1 hypothetical protein [Enterobacter cloacae]